MNTEGSSSQLSTLSSPPASPDPVVPPTAPAQAGSASPGYYNQGQSEEVEAGRSLAAQCESAEHQAALAKEGIKPEFVAAFAAVVHEAAKRQVETAASRDEKKADTGAAGQARRVLISHLNDIQSAAKQHSRVCRARGIEFSLDGYLIGQKLAINRALLLTNSTGLRAKAAKDGLPGYDQTKLDLVAAAHTAFEDSKDDQSEGKADAALATLGRNALIASLTDHRMAILHAFDRIYPASNPANAPTRRLLGLNPHRRLKD